MTDSPPPSGWWIIPFLILGLAFWAATITAAYRWAVPPEEAQP